MHPRVDLRGIYGQASFLIEPLKSHLENGNHSSRLQFVLVRSSIARTNAEVNPKSPNTLMDVVRFYQSGNDFLEAKTDLISFWHFSLCSPTARLTELLHFSVRRNWQNRCPHR